MFVVLSKIVPQLIYPLGLTAILIIAAILLRKRRWQTALLVAALLVLWVGSSYGLALTLVRSLEWQYLPPEETPTAPVIVVLGGGNRPLLSPRVIPEVSESGDRLLYAAWLYHQGAADHILLTGGGIEWLGSVEPEALGMIELLVMMDVPEHAIWIEDASRNTYENALFSQAMLEEKGIQDIILVTSAMHMPRSVPIFEAQGLNVQPAPADYLTTFRDSERLTRLDLRTQIVNFLPDAQHLHWTSLALKEYIGIVVYGLRGWL